jgi:hypothetical protein
LRLVNGKALPAAHGLWRLADPAGEIDIVPTPGITVIGGLPVNTRPELDLDRVGHAATSLVDERLDVWISV